jgi:ABC-type glycerol-3-phosphate transport system substrate-binding protein
MFKSRTLLLLVVLLLAILLAGCSGRTDNKAAAAPAVQAYWQAMVDRDLNKVVASSCAAWEAQARTEFNSFSAVKLKLDNVSCQVAGQSGDTLQVTCTGAIIANYGAEDQTIDIANRRYRVVSEGGEWRMCGYQ